MVDDYVKRQQDEVRAERARRPLLNLAQGLGRSMFAATGREAGRTAGKVTAAPVVGAAKLVAKPYVASAKMAAREADRRAIMNKTRKTRTDVLVEQMLAERERQARDGSSLLDDEETSQTPSAAATPRMDRKRMTDAEYADEMAAAAGMRREQPSPRHPLYNGGTYEPETIRVVREGEPGFVDDPDVEVVDAEIVEEDEGPEFG